MLTLCFVARSPSGAVYAMNKTGPSTLPYRTPPFKVLGVWNSRWGMTLHTHWLLPSSQIRSDPLKYWPSYSDYSPIYQAKYLSVKCRRLPIDPKVKVRQPPPYPLHSRHHFGSATGQSRYCVLVYKRTALDSVAYSQHACDYWAEFLLVSLWPLTQIIDLTLAYKT